MSPVFNPNGKGAAKGAKLSKFAKTSLRHERQTKGAGKNTKGPGKGATVKQIAQHKGSGKTGKSVKLGQAAFVANKNIKTAKSDGNKNYCSYFNQKGCRKGTECAFVHKCNVLTSQTTVCGKDHPASKHVGATVASQ